MRVRRPEATPRRAWMAATALVLAAAMPGGPTCRADRVELVNGGVLEGSVDRDNSLVSVFDGLKRTVVRSSKIREIQANPPSERQDPERFRIEQPMEVTGGSMPSNVLQVQATPWDEVGRRSFRYTSMGADGEFRTVQMRQAINEIGPDRVHFRGIDGFWKCFIATGQVPRPVILGVLARIDQADRDERLRVGRFLIQAKWYDRALEELDRIAVDFPDMVPTVDQVRALVLDLRAQDVLIEAETRYRAGQPAAARLMLDGLSTVGLSPAKRDLIAETLARYRAPSAEAKLLAGDLRDALGALEPEARRARRAVVYDILEGLAEVPDVALERLSTLADADDAPSPTGAPEAWVARAVSCWIGGPGAATGDPEGVDGLVAARDLILGYLAERDAEERTLRLDELRKQPVPGEFGELGPPTPERVESIIRRLPPPLRADGPPRAGAPLIRRVWDDPNPRLTEYTVLLPPEYHPLRSYPAVVALHDGRGPGAALEWWGPEASRRGYIVIAPDYMDRDAEPDYRYTPDEHVAVLLALRDARKRFAIDPDRVFLGGTLLGGNASWDMGLAHPDVFAGVITVSGLPAKFVPTIQAHAEYVPLYVVIGELATASTEALVFDRVASMIRRSWDVTYAEYHQRGLESLPEEAPDAFDWMDRRAREAHRKEFEVSACRDCDDRFHGLVVRSFATGRTADPRAVGVRGEDLEPATLRCRISTTANLMSLTASGITALDVWLAPEFFDFDRPLEIRINRRTQFEGPVTPDLGTMLEDLRVRADRGQLYWARLPLGGKRDGR